MTNVLATSKSYFQRFRTLVQRFCLKRNRRRFWSNPQKNRVGTNAEFFIFKLALFYSAANKRTHTQRNGRANMQYKFRLGRWTDGRNVRIIHPSLFSAIPLLPPHYLFENSNGNPRNVGRDRRRGRGDRRWRWTRTLRWLTVKEQDEKRLASGFRRKWRGFSSLLSSKTVSPVVPSSGFVRAHCPSALFNPSSFPPRRQWGTVTSDPSCCPLLHGVTWIHNVSCLCLIFSESFIFFSIAWSCVCDFFLSPPISTVIRGENAFLYHSASGGGRGKIPWHRESMK